MPKACDLTRRTGKRWRKDAPELTLRKGKEPQNGMFNVMRNPQRIVLEIGQGDSNKALIHDQIRRLRQPVVTSDDMECKTGRTANQTNHKASESSALSDG
jgi:hypothetical protein